MAVKASLQIILKANNIVVAESSDPALWQQTLAGITGPTKAAAPAHAAVHSNGNGNGHHRLARFAVTAPASTNGSHLSWPAGALEAFAAELGLEPAVVHAACKPSSSPPYLRLDPKGWDDLKRHTGSRGHNAIAQVVLSSTLLLLWFRQCPTAPTKVSVKQAQDALRTAGLRDKNAGRGLRNCEWLQVRDEMIRLLPGKIAPAIALARAYCAHRPIEEPAAEKTAVRSR